MISWHWGYSWHSPSALRLQGQGVSVQRPMLLSGRCHNTCRQRTGLGSEESQTLLCLQASQLPAGICHERPTWRLQEGRWAWPHKWFGFLCLVKTEARGVHVASFNRPLLSLRVVFSWLPVCCGLCFRSFVSILVLLSVQTVLEL